MIQVKFHFELSHHLLNCWSSSIIDCYHYPLQNEQANPWISATEDLVLMCLLTTDGYAVSEGDLVAHLALQEADQHLLTGVTPWKPWQLQWQLPVCSLAVPQEFLMGRKSVSVLDSETLQLRESQLQQPKQKLIEPAVHLRGWRTKGELPFYTNALSVVEMGVLYT